MAVRRPRASTGPTRGARPHCPSARAPPTFPDVNASPATGPASPPSTLLGSVARYRGLVALMIGAAAVRLVDLSDWWLNPDEGIYYSILTRDGFGGFWQEVTANAHPPLYYLILRGLGVFTWDFFWFRAFSVLCGLAALAGAWAVARRLAGGGARGEVAGLVAGSVLAFAPGPVELSQVVRPYTLQLALLSWALFFLLRHRTSESASDLAAYVALLALALLTHYSSVLGLGVFGLVVAVQGWRGGLRDDAWRRLALAHVVPALVVVALYLLHLRPLAASALADDALDGWLSFYMIDTPLDVWWSFLGFQHLLAGPWLRGPMAVLLLTALVLAVARWRRDLAVLVAGGLLVAVAAAAAGLYPLGSTRHALWLLAFTVPPLGWVGASIVEEASGRARVAWGGGVLLLVALGGPVGSLLGADRAPWAPADRVLRQDDLGTMMDVLDPAASPDLLLMSDQTFYLFTPFYPADREEAVFAPDSSAFHFPYGGRRILVSRAWDFTLGELARSGRASASDPASVIAGATSTAPSSDLLAFLEEAERTFPDLQLPSRDRAVVLVGGWRPAFVDRLARRPEVRSYRGVPGLHAFVVDLSEMMAGGG